MSEPSLNQPGPSEQDEALLDRYLDGLLPAAEKAAFEERLAADPALRRQVELQGRIDGALARTVPAAPDARLLLARARPEAAKIVRPVFGRRALKGVVALAAAVLVALALYRYVVPPETVETPKVAQYAPRDPDPRPFEQIYAERVAAGFKPDWVCKDDAEFAATFKRELAQPLRVGKLGEGVAGVGLAYLHTLSKYTVAYMAQVDGRAVIVFVNPASSDTQPRLPEGSSLHLHRRVLGKLVLHELSPFDAPRVLASFEIP